MKNLLKAKRRQFNSKKGMTLVELIVAIMILLIVVSATVRGLTVSYRSAMMGAVKNDAQSVAQRNCDIIMSSIVSIAETGTFTPGTVDTLGDNLVNRYTHCDISPNFDFNIKKDSEMSFEFLGMNVAYEQDKYVEIEPINGNQAVVAAQQSNDKDDPLKKGKRLQYYTISRTNRTIGETYQVYKVTTYVYYTDNAFVTCEGEVCVLPEAS